MLKVCGLAIKSCTGASNTAETEYNKLASMECMLFDIMSKLGLKSWVWPESEDSLTWPTRLAESCLRAPAPQEAHIDGFTTQVQSESWGLTELADQMI